MSENKERNAARAFRWATRQPPSDLVFKLAETREEFETAFRLLHDAYVSSGFMRPHPSRLRVTLYHALPTTSTLVAARGSEVVGTVSVIRDSPLGLPMDAIFDLSEYRSDGLALVEVSALAVAAKNEAVLFPLLKYMYEYCARCLFVDQLLIAVHPERARFFQSVMAFSALSEKVVDRYEFVNGAPAVGLTVNIRQWYDASRAAFEAAPDNRSLFHYFAVQRIEQFHLPERDYFKVADARLTPALLEHFFCERTDVFASLSDRERRLLRRLYDHPAYDRVLPAPSCRDSAERKERRYEVRCPALLGEVRVMVSEVSGGGARIFAGPHRGRIAVGAPLPLTVETGRNRVAEVRARAVWSDAQGHFGLQVEVPSPNWERFIGYLKDEAVSLSAS